MHHGEDILLHKLAQDWDPQNRLSAANALLKARAKGEILTGLIYIEQDSNDLHDILNTSNEPLNGLSKQVLCPPNEALEAINAAFR
jgi:2-oxoglutarate ferredoxin oxidoreductase subunit beta